MKIIHQQLIALSISMLATSWVHADLQISPAQRDELIRKYAPEVRFHKDEKYFPMNVNEFLPYVDLRNPSKNVELKKGQVTSVALSGYSRPNYVDYYLGFADKVMKGGVKKDSNNMIHTRAYANFIPTGDGAVIQYIMYYPFNGVFQMGETSFIDNIVNAVTSAADIGDHEADFEHINVRLNSALQLVDVYYARHKPSADGGYAAPEITEGTHPVVYASKYGHAAHPHHKDKQANQDATSSNGPRWRTWEDIQYLGTKDNPTPGNEWMKFVGHFGGTDGGKSSPRGPAHQTWWRTAGYQAIGTLANVRVENNKSADFELSGYLPTYIRKLDWNIARVHTPGITPESIAFNVLDTSNNVVFPDVRGPRMATYLQKKKFRIGNVRVNGQPSNVSFDLEVNALMD